MTIAAIPSLLGAGQAELVSPAGVAGGTSPVAGAGGFANLLSQKLGGVVDLQNEADTASQAVATGKSSDLAGATVAVEKASIAIDLVSAIRNKAVEAYQDVMRMQV
ncbi:MAG: flagellar hook-basal body complex protein FliE [Gaiellaceae bacterium]|jgi:flagellar hook-basal body complex protein FliE|nr:flagellar hook-basal body complex protein FliE [Gaiellaceae bacterium]MDX6570400.1 flagellar hook-basal body complex protein FliE [Gaiellales bacterium]